MLPRAPRAVAGTVWMWVRVAGASGRWRMYKCLVLLGKQQIRGLRFGSEVVRIHDGGSFPRASSAGARGRSRPRVAPGVVSQLIGPVRRSESRVVSDGRGCGTPRWTWRSTRTTAALDGHELLARASSRQHTSKTLRGILFVKRKRNNGSASGNASQRSGDKSMSRSAAK